MKPAGLDRWLGGLGGRESPEAWHKTISWLSSATQPPIFNWRTSKICWTSRPGNVRMLIQLCLSQCLNHCLTAIENMCMNHNVTIFSLVRSSIYKDLHFCRSDVTTSFCIILECHINVSCGSVLLLTASASHCSRCSSSCVAVLSSTDSQPKQCGCGSVLQCESISLVTSQCSPLLHNTNWTQCHHTIWSTEGP